jgi:hypothetical protein
VPAHLAAEQRAGPRIFALSNEWPTFHMNGLPPGRDVVEEALRGLHPR